MGRVGYDTFMEMLRELNSYIAEEYDPDYVLNVRAIGGFSMIVHKRLGDISGPREESRDIDSLTEDYPEEIIRKIKEIGEKYGADDEDGWLNNHWNRTKNYNEEFEFFIRWNKLKDFDMSNISFCYANLEALFMFKIRAMDNRIEIAHLEPREQDVIDVVSILRAYNIKNIDEIQNETIRNTIKYFPYAVNYLIDNGLTEGTRMEIKTEARKLEGSEYGKELAEQAKLYNEENITDRKEKAVLSDVKEECDLEERDDI